MHVRYRVHDSELPEQALLPPGTVLPPHYRGTSRSASLVATVRERLAKGVTLADLTDVKAPQEYYEILGHYGIDHATSAAWFRFGFTPDEVLGWRDKGVRAPATIAPLRDLGVTTLNYAWFRVIGERGKGGRSTAQRLLTVARGRAEGRYGPDASFDDAVYWNETGYSFEVIERFIASGIDYGDIFAARKKFAVYGETAVRYVLEHGSDADFDRLVPRWVDLGYTPEDGRDFEDAGTDYQMVRRFPDHYTAAEVIGATKSGVLPFYLSRWDLTTATELHAAGVTPEQADEIYDAGVTDIDLLLSVARGETPLEWAVSFSGAEVVGLDGGAMGFALAA